MTGAGDEGRGRLTDADGRAQARRARLDAALRANLRRRKAQVRDTAPAGEACREAAPGDPPQTTGGGDGRDAP